MGLGLLILIALGTWQLDRYRQAGEVEQQRDATIERPVVDVERAQRLGDDELEYRRIELTGTWDRERLFLIKHRVYDGDPGFWIVRPLIIDGGAESSSRVIPVNLGWVHRMDGTARARELFSDSSADPVSVTGLLHRPGEIVEDGDFRSTLSGDTVEGLVKLETLDIPAMVDATEHPGFDRPLILVRGPDDESVDEPPVAGYEHITDPYLTPETHFGYMLTWYLLALGLFAIWLAHGLGYLHSRSFDGQSSDRPRRADGSG